jgi:hypothetical protein
MGAPTATLKDSKSKDCVIDPVSGSSSSTAKISASSISVFRLRGPLRATVLVLFSGLEDGGAEILIGFNLDAEADDLVLTNEDVISVCHGSVPLE